MTAVQSEQRELHAASMQSSDTPKDMITSQKDSSTAGQSDDAAISGTADAAQSTVSLTSTDAACRKAAACARSVLEAERTILAAASKTLRTYVICPGILYGELAGRSTLHSTGCPGRGHVLFSAYTKCWRHPNYCSVFFTHTLLSAFRPSHWQGRSLQGRSLQCRCRHAHSHLMLVHNTCTLGKCIAL